MCQGCNPSALQLAQHLLDGVDLSECVRQAAAAAPPPTPAPAGNTIFYGGTIITMAGGGISPVDALAIGSGKVIAAGTFEDVNMLAGSDAQQVNLNGACILPGFVEPHLHFVLSATVKTIVDVSPWTTPTREAAIKKLAQAAQNPTSGWVLAYGYDPSLVQHHLDLDADQLAKASTTVPIFVLNQSGHIAYVNQKAFDESGINNNTQPQAPGRFGKTNGQLNGIVYEPQAIHMIHIPQINPAVLGAACLEILQQFSSKGCTTIFDAGVGIVSSQEPEILTQLSNRSDFPLRFRGALVPEVAQKLNYTYPAHAGKAVFTGIKFWADGSTQGLTAALCEPYLGRSFCGDLNFSNADLTAAMTPWYQGGWQLLIHANGDKAVAQSLSVYSSILGSSPQPTPVTSGMMHRIEHFTVSDEGQPAAAAELGLGVSHTIGHVYYWGKTMRDWVLGGKRAELIDPVAEDVKAKVVYSFHSDSPLYAPDPLLYVRTAAIRQMIGGGVLGPSQCVSIEDALLGVTVNPARQVLLADEIGSLEVGKAADLVIVSADPTVPGVVLEMIQVQQTWFAGKKVWPPAL